MTKVLNIDDLRSEVPFTIRVNGKSHDMAAPTIQNFIDNMKDLEALAAEPDVLKETEMVVRMVVRAFPTLTPEEIKSWPVGALENLFEIIRGVDPDAEVQEEGAEGNSAAES